MRFHTTIVQSDGTATGIRVPDDIVEAFGAGRRPPVVVTINCFTYRSTIAVMGGVYMVGVSAENRAGAAVKGGDEVDVDIELDTAPRTVDVRPTLRPPSTLSRRRGRPSTRSPTATRATTSTRSASPRPMRPGSVASPNPWRSSAKASPASRDADR